MRRLGVIYCVINIQTLSCDHIHIVWVDQRSHQGEQFLRGLATLKYPLGKWKMILILEHRGCDCGTASFLYEVWATLKYPLGKQNIVDVIVGSTAMTTVTLVAS